jgi:hypothetical protein
MAPMILWMMPELSVSSCARECSRKSLSYSALVIIAVARAYESPRAHQNLNNWRKKFLADAVSRLAIHVCEDQLLLNWRAFELRWRASAMHIDGASRELLRDLLVTEARADGRRYFPLARRQASHLTPHLLLLK